MHESKPQLAPFWFLLAAVMIATWGCAAMLEPIEQRYLFQPWSSDSQQLASLAARQKGVEEVRLKTADGVMLHGWLKHPTAEPAGERFPLVIVFGGVRKEISWMVDRGNKPDRWGWLYVNYRGFGLSEGDPIERVILQDVKLIYDYAAARADVDAANIVLFGRSLGTYFAIALAKSRKIRGAILATPFDSFVALGAERYPWLPVNLLISGRYDSVAIAPKINVPALFILADGDDVTPAAHGAVLARAWGGPQRTLTLAGARHYGIERRPDFWHAIGEFLRELEPASPHLYSSAMDAGAQR
jgi:uncharacterized protein